MARFSVAAPMHLIQSVRLCHALGETSHTLCVRTEDAGKFAYLAKFFPLDYEIGEAPILSDVEVSHEEPLTRVGAIARPLVFPHAIIDRCRNGWIESRPHRITFRGLMTPARRNVLRQWDDSRPWRRSNTIVATKRGREFPVKCWDDEYFEMLCRSEFVLCPNGDFVWTYRFFEAVLCGAIPVVEQRIPIYDGFRYTVMSDAVLARPPEAALVNFEQARDVLTVPLAQLETAIGEAL